MASTAYAVVDPPVFHGAEPYGLFAAATLVEGMDAPQRGGYQYSYRCDPGVGLAPGPCASGSTDAKQVPIDGPDTITGDPFTVYAFEVCVDSDFTPTSQKARAKALLQRGEQHAVEKALWYGAGELSGLIDRADVVTLAEAPVSMSDAVSLAEWWLGTQDGTGMLHVNPVAAASAASAELLFSSGAVYRSPMGHNWSFGGGYGLSGPDGDDQAAQGVAWMFVTRPVTIRRSAIDAQGGFTGKRNELLSRAERSYALDYPCDIAAVPVRVLGSTASPVPIPVPALDLAVDPSQGDAPLAVTATITGGQPPVSLDWGEGT